MTHRINSVLLVEDDAITNFLNERLLKKLNIIDHIKITHNGEEALGYMKDLMISGSDFPDLIFLDINMPVVDGFEFLQKYNELYSKIGKNSIIIMLTTSTNPNDMDHLLYSGNTDFLSKPLTENKILSVVNKYFLHQSYKMA